MKSGYWFHLTEFYSVPFTIQTTRIFYNKDLLKEATGTDDPPKDFRQWMDICEAIRENARDFLRFCTSAKKNEEFNAAVHWYPIIKTAKPLDYLQAFTPQTVGAGYRAMHLGSGTPQVAMWFHQQFPLYLDGQIDYDQFASKWEEMWLTKGAFDFVERDRLFKESLTSAERNIGKAQAQMLFEEAGEFKAGQTISQRTNYQLALETMHLLEHGISARAYTWYHLQTGDYPFP